MTDMEIIFGLSIGVWTGTNVVITAVKMANERRDAVLLRRLDKEPLSPDTRRSS